MTHKFKRTVTKFGKIPHWVFLILFVACVLTSVYALRNNNQTMIKLRNEVYAADKANRDVDGALRDLRKYVYGHMNTSLNAGGNTIKPPIQLKYTYERLQEAEQKRVNGVNSNIYTDAQNYCQRTQPEGFYGASRLSCVREYVNNHELKVHQVPDALYKFDFTSPTWSPDLAGWSLFIAALLFLFWLASFTMDKLIKNRIQSL